MELTPIIVACVGIITALVSGAIAHMRTDRERERVQSDLDALAKMHEANLEGSEQYERLKELLKSDIDKIMNPETNWLTVAWTMLVAILLTLIPMITTLGFALNEWDQLVPFVVICMVVLAYAELFVLIRWLMGESPSRRATKRTRN